MLNVSSAAKQVLMKATRDTKALEKQMRAIKFNPIGVKADQFIPSAAKNVAKEGSKGLKQKIAEFLEKALEVAKRTKGF